MGTECSEVKLIGISGSLFCIRVEWALKVKGIDQYDYVHEQVGKKSDLLLKLNPAHKKVPVLVHNGKAIAETLIILDYLDEIWDDKPLLLPKDLHERAMCRFWAHYSDEMCLFGALGACMVEGKEKNKSIECLLELLGFLEQLTDNKKFFGGDEMGYLDVVLGWIPNWLDPLEEVGEMKLLEVKTFPKLYKWSQNMVQFKSNSSRTRCLLEMRSLAMFAKGPRKNLKFIYND